MTKTADKTIDMMGMGVEPADAVLAQWRAEPLAADARTRQHDIGDVTEESVRPTAPRSTSAWFARDGKGHAHDGRAASHLESFVRLPLWIVRALSASGCG